VLTNPPRARNRRPALCWQSPAGHRRVLLVCLPVPPGQRLRSCRTCAREPGAWPYAALQETADKVCLLRKSSEVAFGVEGELGWCEGSGKVQWSVPELSMESKKCFSATGSCHLKFEKPDTELMVGRGLRALSELESCDSNQPHRWVGTK